MRVQLLAVQEHQSCDAISLMQLAPCARAKVVSGLQVPLCRALCTSREDALQCWQSADIPDAYVTV